MPIIAYFPGDVQSYIAVERWRPPLPETCPCCQVRSWFSGHGGYLRYVAEAGPWLQVRIPRFRCCRCGHTFGVLPSFLLPRRHYSACRVQSVLALHYQAGLSRRQLSMHYQGVPALSTCLAWIRRFAASASLWLHSLLTALARFDPGTDPLHGVVSPVGKAHGPPHLLLDLLPQLVASLGVVEGELSGSLAQGLGLLVMWGQGRGLPCLL